MAIFLRAALAGQSFACSDEITKITLATRVATCKQGAHARPWVGPLITVTTLPTTSPHLRI